MTLKLVNVVVSNKTSLLQIVIITGITGKLGKHY